jgi:mannose-1-phosphate guanylyltransferase
MNKIFPIILCGGGGHRLWPLSSMHKPKQFLKLFNNKTLLENTIERFYNNPNCNPPILLTNQAYIKIINNLTKKYNISKIISEPISKNTAPAIATAIIHLFQTNPDDYIIITPSDAYIKNSEFNKYLNTLFINTQNDKIVSLGIKPTDPNTNYGYIEKLNNSNNNLIFSVKQFREKPTLETAKEFLKTNNFLWNSGIFYGKISIIYELFKKHNPVLFKNIENTILNSKTNKRIIYLNKNFYSNCENISIDYALMEKLNQQELGVMELDISWKDIGTYETLETIITKDNDNNAKIGKNIILENSKNNFIISNNTTICCSNINDLLIVEKNGIVFITSKENIQNLKSTLTNFEKQINGKS